MIYTFARTGRKEMSLSAKATGGFAVAAAVTALLLIGQLLWSASRADQLALNHQTQTIRQEFTEIAKKTPYDQQSITIWDDAVVFTAQRFDQVWVDENLGAWMHDYFGHDQILILDRADQVIYSHRDGETQVPPQGGNLRQIIQPLVSKVRSDLGLPYVEASSIQADDILS